MKKSDTDRLFEFLSRQVSGKTLVAKPLTTTTDQGRIAAAYEEDSVYSNLVRTSQGFAFDLTTLTRGTRYVRGKGKGELLAEGSLNTVRVLRYEMTERASTGRLLGHSRFISSTNAAPDPFAGVVFLVQMTFYGKSLVVDESMMGYADFPVSDGSFRPGAVDGKYVYQVNKGRLSVRYQQERFDVDPATLKRVATNDKFPPQVSEEITFPEPKVDKV